MSGIEIAGLVLGAFPIVMKAVSGYADGCRKVKCMYGYPDELVSFRLEVKTEYEKLQSTCEILLQDLVEPSMIRSLVEPTSKEHGEIAWKSQGLDVLLQERYGEERASTISDNFKRMSYLLMGLQGQFKVSESSKKPFARKYMRTFYQAMTFTVLESERKDKLSTVRQVNADLLHIIQPNVGSLGESRHRTNKAAKTLNVYQTIQEQASELYKIIKEKVDTASGACVCSERHEISLRMDVRDVDSPQTCYEKEYYDKYDPCSPTKFRTYISVKGCLPRKEWRGMDVERIIEEEIVHETFDKSKVSFQPTGSAFLRTDIALSFSGNDAKDRGSHLSSPSPGQSPGFSIRKGFMNLALPSSPKDSGPVLFEIPNDTNIIPILDALCSPQILPLPNYYYFNPTKRHRVFTVGHPAPTKNTTLRLLFTKQYTINRKQKLQIAIKLASSVLQLYSSGWLPESWCSEDVEFFEGPDGILLDSPLAIARFEPRQHQTQNVAHYRRGNKTLISLGIVLIELIRNRNLDDCPLRPEESEMGSNAGVDEIRLEHALRLVLDLGDEVGPGYEDAVRRCLKGLDCREDIFEDEDFRKAFYNGVLVPLKKTLHGLMGVYA